MWVTDRVEIPDEPVEALASGRLTIFAGAGVSRGSPTNLPDFTQLAGQLGDLARIPRLDGEPVERYLGRIEDSGFPVHERTSLIVASAQNENRLHRALVALCERPEAVRIVTTNFDTHLSAVAESVWGPGAVEHFAAPALPLGDSFSGVVNLHGAVNQDPSRLVLTDKDFARAYITRGWARQFLLDMFAAGPVVFVGYSHTDEVLQYLARGLQPIAERYAIVRTDSQGHFSVLGIKVIAFSPGEEADPYLPLTEALESWGQLARMGLADHEQRIRDVTKSGPPVTLPETDYVRGVLRDPERIGMFCKWGGELSWLTWVQDEADFQALFQQGLQPSRVQLELAEWYAAKFAIDHSGVAIGVLFHMGGSMSETLWLSVTRQLWIRKASPETRARWIPHLIRTAPRRMDDFLSYLLAETPNKDHATPLLLFEFLTVPVAGLRPSLFEDGEQKKVTLELEIRGDPYWLTEALGRRFSNPGCMSLLRDSWILAQVAFSRLTHCR